MTVTLEALSRDAGNVHPTMLQSAERIGLHFGAALPGPSRLNDSDYMALALANSNANIVGCYPATLQPSQGTFDLADQQAVRDAIGSRANMAHLLIYPQLLPSWMDAALTSDNWHDIVDAHIAGVEPLFSRFDRIQVCNEVIGSDGAYKTSAIATAAGDVPTLLTYLFSAAREAFPNAALYHCEDSAEWDNRAAKRTTILDTLDDLIALGLVDGMCLQGHLQNDGPFTGGPLATFVSDLRSRDLDVCITEADYRNKLVVSDDAIAFAAADKLSLLMRVAIDSGVTWFTFWDIRNDYSWLNSREPNYTQIPLPFASDNSPTLMERALRRVMAA